MSYLYAANLDPRDRSDQVELQMDGGATAILKRGNRYDLTVGELQRARLFIALVFSSEPATAEPEGVYRLPVRGFPAEGDVPVWDAEEGSFVAAHSVSDGSGSVGPGTVPTGIVGGSNLIPNPSLHDGAAGYTAGAGTTLSASSLIGLFGADSISIARTSSTGAASVISSRVGIWPKVPYSASVWIMLGTLGTSTARAATITINWYGPADTFISSSALLFSEPIDGSWYRLALEGVLSPDTAAKAEIQISIAATPASELHILDGFQLQVGDVPTNFGLDLPASTILAGMLAPATLTTREISSTLIDAIVAAAAAAAAPVGRWDFPITIDPRLDSANTALTASNVYYFRVEGKGTITKIAVNVGTADSAGTVAVGVHGNSGSGRAARPSALVVGGSASLSGTGYKEVPLASSISVNHGDWFSLTTNSATATFSRVQGSATTALKQGLAHVQTGGGGTAVPSTPGSLFDQPVTYIMVGVA